jgi:hypothetical protein
MMKIDMTLTPKSLKPALKTLFKSSAEKITPVNRRWKDYSGAPVFTVKGKYTARMDRVDAGVSWERGAPV